MTSKCMIHIHNHIPSEVLEFIQFYLLIICDKVTSTSSNIQITGLKINSVGGAQKDEQLKIIKFSAAICVCVDFLCDESKSTPYYCQV